MGQDIEMIKRRREHAKAAVTRIESWLQESDSESFNKIALQIRLEKLDHHYSKFAEEDSKLPKQMSEIIEFTKKFFEIRAKLQTLLSNATLIKMKTCVLVPMKNCEQTVSLAQKNVTPSSSIEIKNDVSMTTNNATATIKDSKSFNAPEDSTSEFHSIQSLSSLSKPSALNANQLVSSTFFANDTAAKSKLSSPSYRNAQQSVPPSEKTRYPISHSGAERSDSTKRVADLALPSENISEELKDCALGENEQAFPPPPKELQSEKCYSPISIHPVASSASMTNHTEKKIDPVSSDVPGDIQVPDLNQNKQTLSPQVLKDLSLPSGVNLSKSSVVVSVQTGTEIELSSNDLQNHKPTQICTGKSHATNNGQTTTFYIRVKTNSPISLKSSSSHDFPMVENCPLRVGEGRR